MYDYVLKNGLIVDGTREKAFIGSMGIKGNTIERITKNEDLDGEIILDCTDMVISPGFIDLHTHSDACPLNEKAGESMVNQGVTLQIGGNCGISLIPANDEKMDEIKSFFARTVEVVPDRDDMILHNMKDYINITGEEDKVINTGLLVGHGTLRAAVMGFDDRKPTDEEMESMKKLLDEELKSGAFGMSLGLIYPPSSYGTLDEFVELGKVIRENNGIMTTHMRNESDNLFDAVDEMIEVAKKSGVHMHISHLKLMGKPQWGRAKELLDKIENARKNGANITCDQYPYEASATGLSALLPGWSLSGGNASMLERLEEGTEKLKEDIKENIEKRGGTDRILITSTHGVIPNIEGKYLNEISKDWNMEPVDTVIKILLECKGAVATVYFSMHMDDILEIMKSMDIAIGSDGLDFSYDIEYNPHPRNFGTFPRFLRMLREEKIMSIEDGIYKLTGLPARILNLEDRGILKVGNIADITVFDFAKVKDAATFVKSPIKPEGIVHVFVSGKPVVKNYKRTNYLGGKTVLSV